MNTFFITLAMSKVNKKAQEMHLNTLIFPLF